MMVFPGWVNEYSTARGFAVVALLAINPEDSRLRRVLVSIRCRPPGDGGATPRVDKAFLEAKQNRWCPPADEDRRHHFRSLY
jgi:hypothetical protein